MKTTIEVILKDFEVPDFVYEQDRIPAAPGVGAPSPFPGDRRYALRELSVGDLEALCIRFRTEVFKRANKPKPLIAE